MASPAEKSRFRIYSITRLKRMARKWRKMRSLEKKEPPRDIPPGHLAVTVGEAGRRFVIRADYLNHPVFRQLLDQAYQEYGYSKDGPLTIPCDEFHFQEIIHSLSEALQAKSPAMQPKGCRMDLRKDSYPRIHSSTRPHVEGLKPVTVVAKACSISHSIFYTLQVYCK